MNAAELVNKWRHVLEQTEHIWSWSEPESLAYWAELASTRNNIIEIGTHLGKSSKVMLLANPNCRLWCIDGWHEPGTEHTARHFLKAEIEQGRCILTNHTFPGVPDPVLMTHGVEMLLIDNGHNEDEVASQIELFFPALNFGGVMIGHDLDRHPDNGVTQAVKRLLPDFEEPVPRVWKWTKQH